jgi:hypothetical protein
MFGAAVWTIPKKEKSEQITYDLFCRLREKSLSLVAADVFLRSDHPLIAIKVKKTDNRSGVACSGIDCR